MYMGAWLHMFMVKHCRVRWHSASKPHGMKCKWKRSILATMPALSGIMQKSVFTTHIINCLVAHVQLKIINMSLLRNTDLMPYATSIQWATLSCMFSVTSRDKKKKENPHIFYWDAAVKWQWTCVEAPFCWCIRKSQHKVHTCLPFHSLPPENITKEKVYRFWNIFHPFIFLTIYPILG